MFSVIIPLYNKARYILRTLNSVFGQEYPFFEIIVIDDGSTDGGGELVVSEFGNKVRLIRQSNQGVAAARNVGIQNASFDYLAFLDADDVWHPAYLSWMKELLNRWPDAGLLGSSYSVGGLQAVSPDPPIEVIEDYFREADYNTRFTSSSTVIHRNFFKHNSPFKRHLVQGEDIDVWLRAFVWFKKAYYIQAPLMFYDLDASGSKGRVSKLRQSVLYELFEGDFAEADHFSSWRVFRDKYLLLNLYPYLTCKENRSAVKELLAKRNHRFIFASLPYRLPFAIYPLVLSQPYLKKGFRNYLKFCFRFIHQ